MDENKDYQEQPEELLSEAEEQEKTPFVPSPKWKRVFAWVLFVIVALAIINWLAGIAWPQVWPGKAAEWFKNLF